MRALKIVGIVLVAYVLLVAGFESLLGWVQPGGNGTMVITTFEPGGGQAHERVVARLESDGKLYVAANHWPRAWYHRAIANPDVQVTIDGNKASYHAVPIDGEEYAHVNGEHALPVFFRILTGFPPRLLMRLDPRTT
jgi:F420H(2)-dependent quinone reductase